MAVGYSAKTHLILLSESVGKLDPSYSLFNADSRQILEILVIPNPREMKKSDEAAIFLLAFPYMALISAGRLIMKAANMKIGTKAESPPAEIPDSTPAITANPTFNIADRVHSANIHGKKFCFFQYFSTDVIRVTSRGTGAMREELFTRSIAAENSLVFDIDGAIEWIRTSTPSRGPAPAAKQLSPRKVEAKRAPGAKELAPAPAHVPAVESTIVPAPANKAKPFTGNILYFGEVERTGLNDEKPYITYSIKLQSESGSYEKEFIGEHLAELVAKHDLQVGMLVKLQLLGKHHFTVVVDGKTERRCRNEFALTVLPN